MNEFFSKMLVFGACLTLVLGCFFNSTWLWGTIVIIMIGIIQSNK